MADGIVTIDIDMPLDKFKSDMQLAKGLLKDLGDGAGSEMDSDFKKASDSVVSEAKNVKKDVDAELKKPTATITPKVDDSEAQKGTQKVITSLRKLPKEQKVKLDADAKKAGIDDFTTLLKRVPKKTRTEILAQAQKGEVIDYEALLNKLPKKILTEVQLNDNASDKLRAIHKEATSAGGGFTRLKTIVAGSFLGGAALSGVSMLVDGLKDVVVEGANASDAMDKFRSTMQLGGFGEAEIKKTSDQVMDYANKTVYGLDDIANTTAQLAANGIKDYMGLTEAAGNLNAQAGGNAETFKSVAMMLTQTAGAGKLTTENWNQLADAIPGASGVLQKAMKDAGAYTGDFRDAMANGEITAEEFSDALMKLGQTDGAKKAAESTKTFEGAIGNLQAAVVDGMKNVIDAFGKDRITGPINGLGNIVQDTFGKITKTIEDNKKVIDAIGKVISEVSGVVGGVLGQAFSVAREAISGTAKAMKEAIDKISEFVPFLSKADKGLSSLTKHKTAIKAVGTALGAITTGVLAFKTAEGIIKGFSSALTVLSKATKIATAAQKMFNIVMSLNPIALTVGVVVALGVAFYQAYKHIKPFRDAVNKSGKVVADFAKNAWKSISSFFNQIVKTTKKIWKEIEPIIKSGMKVISAVVDLEMTILKKAWSIAWNTLSTTVKVVWKIMEPIVKLGMGVIKGVISGTMSIISGLWKGAWNLIKGVLHGVWEIMKPIVKTALDVIADVINIVTNAIKGNWSGVWNGIKNLFSDIWNGIKSIGSGAINGLKDIIIGVAKGIDSAWRGIWDGVAKFFSGIWDGMKDAAKAGFNGIIDFVNGGIKGINGVVHFFGGKKQTIDLIPRLKDGGRISKSTLALVNDEESPTYREAIFRRDGSIELPQERNVLTHLEAGDAVMPAKQTAMLLGLPQYKGGFGDWLGKAADWIGDVSGDVGEWLADKIDQLEDALKNPLELLMNLFKKEKNSATAIWHDIGEGAGKYVPEQAVDWFKGILDGFKKKFDESGGSNPPGEGAKRWEPYVKKALAANGLPTTDAYVQAWLRQIQSESGGNPKAVQGGYVDQNTISGDLAKGLLQTISATFNAYKFPGHGNIFNGYDNMLAAIHYAKARYGSDMLAVIGHGHGYANGGHIYNKQLAWIAEDGDEFVINNRKPNADSLLASAIKQRAEINPNSFSAKIAHIIDSAKFSGSNGYGMAPSTSQSIGTTHSTQGYTGTDYSQQIEAINRKLDIIADKQVKVDGRSFAVAYERYGVHERNQRDILGKRGMAVDVNF